MNIDAADREAFLAFSENQHKEHMNDFEEIWLLHVTKMAATTNGSGKITTKVGARDTIAK